MFERLRRALFGRDWKPGFHPRYSRMLDVGRALAPETAPEGVPAGPAGGYRSAGAVEHRAAAAADLGPVHSLVYLGQLIWHGEDTDRKETSLRRVAVGGPQKGQLLWEHRVASRALFEGCAGRVRDTVLVPDPEERLMAVDSSSGEVRWRTAAKVGSNVRATLDGAAVHVQLEGGGWSELALATGHELRAIGAGTRGATRLWQQRAGSEAVRTARGEVRVDGAALVLRRGAGGHAARGADAARDEGGGGSAVGAVGDGGGAERVEFGRWQPEREIVRCGDSLVLWAWREESTKERAAALLLVDAETLERVGEVALGTGSASLSLEAISVDGRYVQVTGDYGRDEEGEPVSIARLVDVPARRVLADLELWTRASVVYAQNGTVAFKGPI